MSGGKWGDLAPRVLSAVVMLAVGAAAIWAGGLWFKLLVIVAVAAMVWELARMTEAPGSVPALWLGGLGALAMTGIAFIPGFGKLALVLLPAIIGTFRPRRDAGVFAAYAIVILLTGLGLVVLREGFGLLVILWIVAVVVVSDVAGYFAGRILGGPKFWPAVSPKKTWSGTVAGWVGAALVGWAFHAAGHGGAGLVWLSPLVAFAGQLGDIAESAIKRRAGVKDSSNLIPGHGGVMDRFDALAFAVVAVLVLVNLVSVPVIGG
ncbi:phosphatidate cytidylyltransferase [Gemmobacter caeruleus]|uniref:phosphatidate cytidylyltransferase n=1 Tax=Gemmobacter caeruleus TaxID=2595004 RepID=UPI0011ECCD48|nr:phosphatidate cytidylyltransferase [Gemmobacter caeruleus]